MCDYYCSYLLDSYPHPASPSFSINLLTHGQEQVSDVDSYRATQHRNKDSSSCKYTNTQAHQFIPIPVCFLNSLQVPFGIHSLWNFFFKTYTSFQQSPLSSAENSLVFVHFRLCTPGKEESHLTEEPKSRDFPNPAAPLEFLIEPHAPSSWVTWFSTEVKALQNFRNRVWREWLFLGPWGCEVLSSL